MSVPISWLAVQRIAALLATITVANGYYTDLGANAARINVDGSQVIDDQSSPWLVVSTESLAVDESGSGKNMLSSQMDVLVECLVPVASGNASELAHRARADIVRALRAGALGAVEGIGKFTVGEASIDSGNTGIGTQVVVASVSVTARIVERFAT
jgi:hypothetical protein